MYFYAASLFTCPTTYQCSDADVKAGLTENTLIKYNYSTALGKFFKEMSTPRTPQQSDS